MPSPSGLFVGLTQAQLDTLRAGALQRIATGERTSMSGGAKSGSRAWQMSPQDVLFEVNYAQNILSGIPRPQKVVQILNPQYCVPNPGLSTVIIP